MQIHILYDSGSLFSLSSWLFFPVKSIFKATITSTNENTFFRISPGNSTAILENRKTVTALDSPITRASFHCTLPCEKCLWDEERLVNMMMKRLDAIAI